MKELFIRALSGLAYVAIILGSIYLGATTFYALFFVLMMLCLFEFKRLIDLHYNWAYIVAALIFVRFSELEIFQSKYFHFFLIISLFIPFIYQLFVTKIHIASSKIGHFFLAVAYIALPFSFMTSIPFIDGEYHPKTIMSIFVLIWANDTFAYITGTLFGKNKLYEKISPNKTVEGAVGGLIATVIAAYFLANYVPILTLVSWLIIAALISVFGVLGDLIESKFKREAQVKDSSNLIPGHGGFLDRLDSIIFAAPFIYVYLHLFY